MTFLHDNDTNDATAMTISCHFTENRQAKISFETQEQNFV